MRITCIKALRRNVSMINMRHFFLNIALCGTLLVLSTASYGITLQECVDRAISNSKLVAALNARIEAGGFAYKKDKGALFPQVSVTNSIDPTRDNGGIAVLKAGIDLQKILTNYSRQSFLALEQNNITKDIAVRAVKKTILDNYYELYILLQKKRDYAVAQAYFADHIKDIEKLGAAGVDVKLDLERARIKKGAIAISANDIDSKIRNLIIELNSLMEAHFSEGEFSTLDVPSVNTDVNYYESLKAVFEQNIDNADQYRSGKLDVEIAGAAYKQAGLYFIPALGLEFDRAYNDLPGGENYNFLTLDLPLFDSRQRANDRLRLKSEYNAQKMNVEANRRDLIVHVEQVVSEIENEQSNYLIAQENVKGAEKLLALAPSYYRMGKIKETDLLDIVSSYLDAKQEFYDTISGYLSRGTELEYLLQGVRK